MILLTDNCFWCGIQKEINGSWINKWQGFGATYWFLSPIYSALNLIINNTLHLFEKIACKWLHEVYLMQFYFSWFKINYDFWAGKTVNSIPALGKYLCISSPNHYVEALQKVQWIFLKKLAYVKAFIKDSSNSRWFF